MWLACGGDGGWVVGGAMAGWKVSEWEGSGGIVNLETSGLKQIGRDERQDGGRVAHWRSTYYLTDTSHQQAGVSVC